MECEIESLLARPPQELSAASRQHQKLRQELELKTHSLELLRSRVASSESAQLSHAVADLEAQVEEAQSAASVAQERKAALVEEAKQLEKDIANFGKEKSRRIKAGTP